MDNVASGDMGNAPRAGHVVDEGEAGAQRGAMQKAPRAEDIKLAWATGPLPNKRGGGARLPTGDPPANKGKRSRCAGTESRAAEGSARRG